MTAVPCKYCKRTLTTHPSRACEHCWWARAGQPDTSSNASINPLTVIALMLVCFLAGIAIGVIVTHRVVEPPYLETK